MTDHETYPVYLTKEQWGMVEWIIGDYILTGKDMEYQANIHDIFEAIKEVLGGK
jgi:hypothetical protein